MGHSGFVRKAGNKEVPPVGEKSLHAYEMLGNSLSNPSVSRTDPPVPEEKSPEMERTLPRDAQAACEFSLLMSKSSQVQALGGQLSYSDRHMVLPVETSGRLGMA
jgi:hypothetical protein